MLTEVKYCTLHYILSRGQVYKGFGRKASVAVLSRGSLVMIGCGGKNKGTIEGMLVESAATLHSINDHSRQNRRRCTLKKLRSVSADRPETLSKYIQAKITTTTLLLYSQGTEGRGITAS